jgi:hypothetical protein
MGRSLVRLRRYRSATEYRSAAEARLASHTRQQLTTAS